ncbi:hypothetical protein FA13DRAFT_549047 [Coprinellus micaceus]|uniref:Uncharacterized protein n=1 Tax=Coprinellus micaceus TaxID=71717 RepID=A0A4Y7T864_COPMI|nr:hypothetical protein FA13DRAFT_549047 [Coprinellus micaceus]
MALDVHRSHLSARTCANRACGLLYTLLSYMSHAYSTTEERSRLLGVIKNLSSAGIRPFSPSNIVLSVTMYLLNTTCCSYYLRYSSKIRDDDIMQAVENCVLPISLAICRSTSERCGKPDRRV